MKIPKEVSEFLSESKFCVIATSNKGKTEAATMSVVFDGTEVLMFTSKSTRKYANIKENENVALVYSSSDHSKDVQVDGEASLSDSNSVKERIIKLNPAAKAFIENKEHGETAFIVVKPKRIYFVDYTKEPTKTVLLE